MRIFCIFLLLFSLNSFAKELKLAEGESIVMANVGRHSFKFEEVSTGKTFVFRGGDKYKYVTKRVAAGKYYLKSIDPIFPQYDKLEYEKPKGQNGVFNVGPESVTYLGDWVVSTEVKKAHKLHWAIERDYSFTYLKQMLNRHKHLDQYPLVLSNEQGKMVNIPWEKIAQSK